MATDQVWRKNEVCLCVEVECRDKPLGRALLAPTVHNVHYQPFGILVAKPWLYDQGGRPVIYQPDTEFFELPEHLRWRHVRYEPTAHPPIDFSWEREWRIPTESLRITPDTARIVLPTDEWFQRVERRHDTDQSYDAQMYELVIGEAAWGLVEAFPWTAHVLQRIGA